MFVEALSRGLAARGHEVDVIHCADAYRALAPHAPVDVEPAASGVTVHTLRSPVGRLSPLATHLSGYPVFKAAELGRILAWKSFDVIHFHNISLVGGPAVLRYGSAIKLYTIHEHWLLCPTHSLFRDKRELCVEKRCIPCSLRYGRPPQLWRYGRLLEACVKSVDRFIAPTEFTRQIHLASGLPMQIAVLGNFHEPGPLPSDLNAPARPYFVYAGRLEAMKGVRTLIEAFRAYRDADLIIAGDGAEASDLRACAAGCDHITFLGLVPRARLPGLFAHARAVVLPSLGHEVFPLVVLEAFAVGTPVVARDRGALAEIVAASGGGLRYRDGAELLGAVRRLQTDAPFRDALGAAGEKAWRTHWTADVHIGRYLSLVEGVRRGKQDRPSP